MRFGLLGPVIVHRGGALVPVRGPMPRSILATLLINANQVVPVDHMVDVLWGMTLRPARSHPCTIM
jgi:DNA-binding SARP family transcriptional activator